MPSSKRAKAPHVLSERFSEPDLVDRIFDYVVRHIPALTQSGADLADLKAQTRAEFRGEEVYIPKLGRTERQQRVAEVLRLFNGRNASEVARELHLSRATVYRMLKQEARVELTSLATGGPGDPGRLEVRREPVDEE